LEGAACAVDIVPVQYPPSEEQRSPLVALSESLSPRQSTGQHRCRLDRVVDRFDGSDCPLDTVEIVRLIEPLAMFSHRPVDGDRKTKCRTLQ
jgi:hypothetical protein